MQSDAEHKQQPQIDMEITPLRFRQSPQAPVGPVGYPSLGYDVENNDRDTEHQK